MHFEFHTTFSQRLLTVCLLLFVHGAIYANDALDDKYFYIVQVQDVNDQQCNTQLQLQGLHFDRILFPSLGILRFWSKAALQKSSLQAMVAQFSCVASIGADQLLETRNMPNDEFIEEQWALQRIEAFAAWDSHALVRTEAHVPTIGIIESDFYLAHEDLVGNRAWNPGEIANNNIDDDGNGYVDDRYGLNLKSKTDAHVGQSSNHHGMATLGVAAAKGDNGIGISGIAWDLPYLPVSNGNQGLRISELIEACNYYYDLRQTYNTSDGNQGVFIVAINTSLGLSNAQEHDHPYWCEVYNTLGSEGILSVVAAPNQPLDIERLGDLPSSCSSPFLISVCATDQFDRLRTAYGKQSVDIAAPGISILSCKAPQAYQSYDGTSMAAPQVTASIPLIYCAASEKLRNEIMEDPSIAALSIKTLLLQNSLKLPTLKDRISSGGLLNLKSIVQGSINYAPAHAPSLYVRTISNSPDNYILHISSNQLSKVKVVLINALGQLEQQYSYRNQGDLTEKIIQIPKQGLISGIHYIYIQLEDQELTRSFLIY